MKINSSVGRVQNMPCLITTHRQNHSDTHIPLAHPSRKERPKVVRATTVPPWSRWDLQGPPELSWTVRGSASWLLEPRATPVLAAQHFLPSCPLGWQEECAGREAWFQCYWDSMKCSQPLATSPCSTPDRSRLEELLLLGSTAGDTEGSLSL